ncbi:aminoglycoside phosphotransferase family protein [Paenibacillus anaericanus]|uniref:Aminoglycoside phosphotransferase family protein n=1 Tax=Paenibacillus anaericanus TaxID=170367 RepID=A0A3S1DZS2_9BACL|nr:aminoglycoside phosphotransferase family protein [Paenibacillus anaericanus]RUT48750.1 aminoglycoside phosphotransferase family protein [Paenibacillus anaericanus]
MNRSKDSGGYDKGRLDGFNRGKQDGYNKGREDARGTMTSPLNPQNSQTPQTPQTSQAPQTPQTSQAPEDPQNTPLNEVSLKWREFHCADKISGHFGHPVTLNDGAMECLKDTVKSTIWRLEITANQQSYPMILKIFKAPVANQDLIELNMYRKASGILPDLMPLIYSIEEGISGGDIWVFMEFVQQLKGQVNFTPDHFDKIIPALAKLHAQTHNERFLQHWDVFADWLPRYHSESSTAERQKNIKETLQYLDKAMDRPDLKIRLDSSYYRLQIILHKGPDFFPELLQAGKSIIHNDLQSPNIGCNNVVDANWNIKFIDWEGARFAPCWFDMFNLLGVFFAYRKDWRSEEDAVIHRCAHLYAAEMVKYGINFQEDPVKLYKMAYLQRVLERSLYLQLQWATEGQKQAFLLEGYLEKIEVWGKELGLY